MAANVIPVQRDRTTASGLLAAARPAATRWVSVQRLGTCSQLYTLQVHKERLTDDLNSGTNSSVLSQNKHKRASQVSQQGAEYWTPSAHVHVVAFQVLRVEEGRC